jgi:hypothetical protein
MYFWPIRRISWWQRQGPIACTKPDIIVKEDVLVNNMKAVIFSQNPTTSGM